MSASETLSENAPNSSSYSHSSHLAYMINEVYRTPIEETVDFALLISCMPCMMSILGEVYIKQSQGKRKEVAKLFFDHLLKLEDEGKFQSFVDALKQAQYKLLASAIENEAEIPYSLNEHKQLIGIFFNEIAEIIDPNIVSQELQMKEVISSAEGESIRNAVRNSSRQQAAFELLEKIPHRTSNWYEVFLNVLLELGHKNLVQKIDPKFCGKITKGIEAEGSEEYSEEDYYCTSPAEWLPPSVGQSSTSPLPGSSSQSSTQASAESSKYIAPKAATTSANAAVNPATQRSSVGARELNQERKTELSELKLVILKQTELIHILLSKVEQLENKIGNVESKLEVSGSQRGVDIPVVANSGSQSLTRFLD